LNTVNISEPRLYLSDGMRECLAYKVSFYMTGHKHVLTISLEIRVVGLLAHAHVSSQYVGRDTVSLSHQQVNYRQ
jgi:hypothetical protein